jgi:hypothetical protein
LLEQIRFGRGWDLFEGSQRQNLIIPKGSQEGFMFFEMLPIKNLNRGSTSALLLLFGALFLAGCAGQSSGSDYVNPSRPENYDAEERSYEKPWPFGDLGNGH